MSIEGVFMWLFAVAVVVFCLWSNHMCGEWAREYYAYEDAHRHCCPRPYQRPRRNV